MYTVVCYDVTDDNRRNRLFGRLKGFLRHVQKSVFEGPLPQRRYPKLLETIEQTIDRELDTVRIYHLCQACHGLTDLLGTSVTVAETTPDLVI